MDSKKEINVRIGSNIKREREKAGFTQDRFSEMIGLGTKSLSAIERGTVGASITTLQKICTTLSISSDALIFGAVEKNDVSELAEKLARLSPKQLEIANEIFSGVLAAFNTPAMRQ